MQDKNSITVANLKRAYALDALRGFAILAMILSGTIEYKILPAWMYHAQEPPPTHTFNSNLPGLTWVDIVFPIFLFSMGAAIPLALANRLKKGFTTIQVILYILKRGLLLGIFAIFLQHIRPLTINRNPSEQTWWIALLGFLILFFMFVRWPVKEKYRQYTEFITIGAWFAAIILVCFLRYPDGSGFSLARSDIILVVLTNMAIFGAIAWFFTKDNLLLRLGLLGLLIALRLSASVKGSWIAVLWKASPIPWIFQFDYLKYLFIIIPGTIAGDLILDWLQIPVKNGGEEEINSNWNHLRCYSIIFLMLTLVLGLLIGLQARWLWQTALLSTVLCLISWFLFVNPNNEKARLLQAFYQWGIYWLVLGLLFEPFEKGIKKDPATLSYFFVTTAIALFLLITFTIIIDVFQQRKYLQLLIDNGQNPMVAYVAFANFLWPVLKLTYLEPLILEYTNIPLIGFIKGVIYTLLIAFFVSLCTKLKLLWRT
ncbi:DUF5009 domain-containing protein [Fischerella sp. PCC 9605]|uniref:DUF5009 domain-containing protein n=1 Tax=Fischerella sp. PCC 9605 TaxID=1173024 RepID=UPI0004B13587|nr:DUF5009 domain-containing protein [Fischerella sp. PCC 9605]